MVFTRHRVASAAVFAALAAGLPGALAVDPLGSAATGVTVRVTPPALSPPGCPDPNPAWGCGPFGAGQGSPASTNGSRESSRRPARSRSSVTFVGCGASCLPKARPASLE